MSEQPVQLDTLVVQVHEVPLRKVPGGPDRIFVQTDGTGNVLVDFADGLDEWGKPLELNEAEYEGLRQEAFRRELADLEDIPSYTQLYPSSKNSGAITTPNGNTLGRVNGETPATGDAADYSNPEVESETPAEGITGDEILDGLQLGLDVVGLIPVFGEFADVANAGISLARGDYAGAALSLLSAIPFVGYLGTAGKVGRYSAKAAAEASTKAAKQMADRAAKEAAEKTAKEGSEHAIKRADDVASKSKDGAKVTGGTGLGGFKVGLSADDITAINSKFGGSASFREVDTAIANAANYDGFYNKAGSLIRDIAGGHLFDNGNKRTAVEVVEQLIIKNGVDGPPKQIIWNIVDKVATGKLTNVQDISKALRGLD